MEDNILLSKLIPPEPAIHYMRRAKVMKKLARSHQTKLTILHGGAGYGKSSALAQFLADQSNAFSWYQVTEDDDDVLPFLRHLFYSVRNVYPSFGETMNGWDQLPMFPKVEELNKLFTLFVNEFCKTREPFFVILDDYYLVDHIFHIHYIMEKLILHLPPNVHLIISSRTYPSWGCIRNLRLNHQLVECVEEDFVFSAEEIQVFFEDYFQHHVTEEQVDRILQTTEGWAIAILFLATQSIDLEKSMIKLQNLSTNDFFNYLSHEVLETLDDSEQDAIMKFSIFETFSYEIIETFYGETFAEQLKNLVNKHVFIQPLRGHTEFRYHVLFQQFLELKMMETDLDTYNAFHLKAAKYFTQQRNPVKSVYHAMKTKNEDLIASSLAYFANQFIEDGKFDWFIERIRELSESTMANHFHLYYYEGESQRYRAQYEKAKKAYEKCITFAEGYESYDYILKAKAGIAHIYLDTIQPSLAENYLQEALELAERAKLEGNHLQLIQKQYAENLVNLGKPYEAEKWVSDVGLSSEIVMRGNLDARILLRQGKLQEARSLLENRLDSYSHISDTYRETDVLYSFILILLGDYVKALESANKSILKKENEHAQYIRAVAHLRKGHTLLVLNPGDITEAEQCYKKTIEMMDRMDVKRAKAESYMGLAIVKSRQHQLGQALLNVELGLKETEKVHDHWVSALLYVSLSIIYVEHEQYVDAKDAITKAQSKFENSKDYFGLTIVSFWHAYIAYMQNDDVKFAANFELCMATIVEKKYDFFVKGQHIFGPQHNIVWWQLMHHWTTLQQSPAKTTRFYQLLEVDVDMPVPAHMYNIQLFGAMTVYRDGEVIVEKAWQREKAKELFIYLYLNRTRFVSKEEVINVLWPKATEETMTRDFKVAYNALLKVLEPNRLPRIESAYVVRKQSMYKLITQHCMNSDLDFFRQFISLGMQQKNPNLSNEWLLRGIQIYKGEFIADKRKSEWLQDIREELKCTYMEGIERLAQNYVRLKEFSKTVYWAEHLLKQDNTWEEGYRLIMNGYFQLQNRTQAVRWFEKCEQVLKDELNIEPMETTIQMYEMILK
ncbi:transcriptional regulator [Viridibacillus sp. YIM B01967]|uniref:Transcriptional regulator n=1 Tax=Viridibacillus soli TaxID=2798301 RepID=A0ABS1H6L1_9BACL|nr:BTAD domain-containing putative transcriptional regulator [Viridibacillus soli]MBK3495030.1 transcriptional regulator [Viridibacillus soli]